MSEQISKNVSSRTSNNNNNNNFVQLPELPDILLENIFKFLTYREVTELRETSYGFYRICRRFLRVGFKKLRRDIVYELCKTREQINECQLLNDAESILKRAPIFRKYNRLELLFSDLNIISVVCRHLIEDENVCFPSGILLDAFVASFQKIQRDTHEHWSVMDFTSGDLQLKIKLFLDDYREKLYPLTDIIPIGVQVVDLMDTMLETDYDIMIIYDLDNMICQYTAQYEQRKPKFLSYTSQLPRKPQNKYVSLSEMIELMKQLQLIVRIHNELLLRQEQYWREMDVVNLRMITADEDNSREIIQTNMLIKEPRLYSDQIPDKYEILSKNKICQKYSKSYASRTRYPRFVCNIELKCFIKNAPLTIQRNFQKLIEKIRQDSDLISLRSSSTSIVSNETPIDEIYSVTIEFHLLTSKGLFDDEIVMKLFEIYWQE